MIGRKKTAVTNPFLRPEPEAPIALEDASTDAMSAAGAVMVTGAPMPSGAAQPSDPLLVLPEWVRSSNPFLEPDVGGTSEAVQVVALHGGAGASTVAALLADAVDCGTGLSKLRSRQLPVVLVTRTHGAGVYAASRAGRQWAAGGLEPLTLLGLVLVDDAPDLGSELERAVQSAQRIFPRSWRLGWCEPWRLDPALPDPDHKSCPRRARQVRKSVLLAAKEIRDRPEQNQEIELDERKTS